MTMFDCTLIIPMHSQPNHLAMALQGLVKHSLLSHRILVVYSRPEVQGHATARDFIFAKRTEAEIASQINTPLKGYHKYHSVQEYHEKHRDWCEEHHIEFHDVTEQALVFEEQYKMGHIYPGGIWEGGQDTAFKDNIGLTLTDTELIVNNWDADFYPGPGWDAPLAHLLRHYQEKQIVAIPVHIQPYKYKIIPEWKNIFEDTRDVACNRPVFALPWERDNGQVYEHEWIEFVQKWQREEIYAEPGGLRDYLHYLPIMMRTVDARRVGEYCYKGSGYEIEMDDRRGKMGFLKVCHRTSFIMHKGFIVDEDDA